MLDPNDPAVIAERPRRGHPGGLDGRRPALAGLRAGQEVQGGPAAAPGVPDHADGLVHPAAVTGGRPAARPGARRRGRRQSCSAPSTRCGSRWSTWPSCSPPATPARSPGAAASSRPCGPTCATSRWATAGRRVDPRRGGNGQPGDVRDVPAAGHRQVRGALRHPQGPRRSRPTTWRRWAARWISTADRTGWTNPARSARPAADPSRWRWRPSTPCKQRQTSGAAPTSDETLRGRVNLLNWDGNGPPPGCSRRPPRGRRRPGRARHEGRRSRREATGRLAGRVLVPGLPRRRAARPCRSVRAALADAAPARSADFAALLDFAGRPHRPWRAAGPTMCEMFDLPASTRCTCPTGPTGTPAAAASAWLTIKQRYRRRGFLVDTARGAARLPADGAGVRRPSRTRRRGRAAAGLPGAAWSCSGWPWSSTATPHAGVLQAVCATLPGDLAGGPAGRDGDGRATGRRPKPWAWTRTIRGCCHSSKPVRRLMDVLLWGVLPYIMLAVLVGGMIWRYRYDQFGWTTRSSQLYESRLLRIGSPLFHFGMLVVIVGHFVGLVIPKSLDRAVGVSEDLYHLNALALGSRRRGRHAGRRGHLDLPAADHRTGLHGHHQERQDHVRGAGRRHRRRAVATTVLSVFAPDHGPQLPRDRVALVPLAVHPAAGRRGDGGRAARPSRCTS